MDLALIDSFDQTYEIMEDVELMDLHCTCDVCREIRMGLRSYEESQADDIYRGEQDCE